MFFFWIDNGEQDDSQYEEATLMAVTNSKKCIGIKIFPNKHNADTPFTEYIDKSIAEAFNLKLEIEENAHKADEHPNVVHNPSIKRKDSESIVSSQLEC